MFWVSHLYLKILSWLLPWEKKTLSSNHSNHLERNICSGHRTFWSHRSISIQVRIKVTRQRSSLGSTMEAVCLGGYLHNEVPWQWRGRAPATLGHVMVICGSSRIRATYFPSSPRAAGNTQTIGKGWTVCFNPHVGKDNGRHLFSLLLRYPTARKWSGTRLSLWFSRRMGAGTGERYKGSLKNSTGNITVPVQGWQLSTGWSLASVQISSSEDLDWLAEGS